MLGFSPIHEHFDWYIFVGSELRPFVNGRGIQGMKQIQTQEFEQLTRYDSGDYSISYLAQLPLAPFPRGVCHHFSSPEGSPIHEEAYSESPFR